MYSLKNLWTHWYWHASSLHVFLITMHEIDTTAEVYLEPIQTYMIEIFCKNKQLLAHNSNKSSIIEDWHDSKYAS